MRITNVFWLEVIVEKLASKHGVSTDEVEEAIWGNPRFRFVERGERQNEDVYTVLGQSEAGRYLAILFIHKQDGTALILSARDMAEKERRIYARK
ncbi:MAG: BrnT family toxin [Chloroflexi bacterium]|nr:BrnT family toxin [Chloroflexota bacterium]